jgi:uncharacterized membrane protein
VAERQPRRVRLDTPVTPRRSIRPHYDPDAFGRVSEQIARFLGTARFLVYLTGLVAVWLLWNTFAPVPLQFDPRATNFTLLTLILSLQASYAAPLILLAQNRQDDRDRVQIEQDRQRAERNLADTEYLAREIVALRMVVTDVSDDIVTKDVLRAEIKALLEQLDERAPGAHREPRHADARHTDAAER